ncbi:MAG TPA: hypothetical protein VFV38_27035 [Ktedonobacteraceae bacterium]|nr:hypothetical protein [Ktedonobacteraceae bacterium]
MTVIQRLPYSTPSPERIRIGEWSLLRDGDAEPLGELLPGWDPAVNLQVAVDVWLDLEGIYQDCHLGSDAVLRLAAVWESTGTVLRGHGELINLQRHSTPLEIRLTAAVEGIKLAGKLDLSVNLVLLRPSTEVQPFAAKIPGSILAQQTQSVLLEGEGARFPTEVIDFTNTHYPSEAAWALYWDPDNLDQTISGEVRLYINARHKRVVRAVSDTLPEDEGIREAVRFDVARTMIYGALNNLAFVEEPDTYKSGTSGAAVRNMLQLYFPETPFSQLRTNSQQPQSFDPKLQERLRLFWEE